MTAMAFDKAPGQRKPDSGATAFTAAGLVRTIKIIKYMGQICRRNPLAIIRYRQKQRSPGRPAVNPDIPPSRRIALRISQHIIKDLLHSVPIGLYRRQCRKIAMHLQPLLIKKRLQHPDNPLQQSIDIQCLPVQHKLSRFRQRKLPQFSDQTCKAHDFLLQKENPLHIRLYDPLQHVLKISLQNSQWRAKFMCRVRQKLPPHLLGTGKLLRHLIKRLCELTDFVTVHQGNRRWLPALPNGLSSSTEALQGHCDLPGQQVARSQSYAGKQQSNPKQ